MQWFYKRLPEFADDSVYFVVGIDPSLVEVI